MKQLSIRQYFVIFVGFSLLFMLFIGGSGLWISHKIANIAGDVAGVQSVALEKALTLQVTTLNLRRFEKDMYINMADREKYDSYMKKWSEKRALNDKLLIALDAVAREPKQHELLKDIRTNLTVYYGGIESVDAQIRSGQITTTQAANDAINKYKKAAHSIDTFVASLNDTTTKQMAAGRSAISPTVTRGYYIVGGILLLALLLAITGATLTLRAITCLVGGELHQVIEIARQVAQGNLSYRFEQRLASKNSIMGSIEEMVISLRNLVIQVLSASQNIASAAIQLHRTAEQIATGSEELTSQVNTVAVASEEMAATSTSIAESCQRAANEAGQADTAAKTGAVVVAATVSGMERITAKVSESASSVDSLGSRSEQIGAIVATIEDIADQTNLLALNAAIEAARAGEMGRGFAVVADEVRALAERTTRATREIGEMIKNIQAETQTAVATMNQGVREVQQGSSDASRSGEALQEILARINEVTMQVNQIATAAEEQAATTGEITNNLQQVTDVVHSSSRSADETASAAAQLSRQAEELQQLMQRFKL